MLINRVLRWGLLLALGGWLAGCEPPVAVNFAQPFPATASELHAFPAQLQGHYRVAADTTLRLVISSQDVVEQRVTQTLVTARQLDSLGLSPRQGLARSCDGQLCSVQPLATGTFWLRQEQCDTLASLAGPAKLRRYRNWFYLSTPNADTPATWTVQRLAVVQRRLFLQSFGADSLRIRALCPATAQLCRTRSQLIFTLDPAPGGATRQVNKYSGLWLASKDYQQIRQPSPSIN